MIVARGLGRTSRSLVAFGLAVGLYADWSVSRPVQDARSFILDPAAVAVARPADVGVRYSVDGWFASAKTADYVLAKAAQEDRGAYAHLHAAHIATEAQWVSPESLLAYTAMRAELSPHSAELVFGAVGARAVRVSGTPLSARVSANTLSARIDA